MAPRVSHVVSIPIPLRYLPSCHEGILNNESCLPLKMVMSLSLPYVQERLEAENQGAGGKGIFWLGHLSKIVETTFVCRRIYKKCQISGFC